MSQSSAFAAKQNASADTFLAANPSPPAGEGDSAKLSGVRDCLDEAEAGMEEMSQKFREHGGEIYLSAKE